MPSGNGAELVIAYQVVANRAGSPVGNEGKVVVRPEDLR